MFVCLCVVSEKVEIKKKLSLRIVLNKCHVGNINCTAVYFLKKCNNAFL